MLTQFFRKANYEGHISTQLLSITTYTLDITDLRGTKADDVFLFTDCRMFLTVCVFRQALL